MVESTSMEVSPSEKVTRKRKKNTVAPVNQKSPKTEDASPDSESPKKAGVQKKQLPQETLNGLSKAEIEDRFPVLRNEELVQKFMSVPLTNNQKGRIRQVLRDNLKGTSDSVLPDVIHTRIQAVLKTPDLTDAELRKIRILYNMLKTAIQSEKVAVTKKSAEKIAIAKTGVEKIAIAKKGAEKIADGDKDKKTVKRNKDSDIEHKHNGTDKKDQIVKVKGQKRYVVFVGNLPLGIDKEKITSHFSELVDQVVSVRIPKRKPDSKSAIAYVELRNEHTFELALSKHHSMLGNKRINVMYTTQKKTKISKTEAKSKTAKLVALQKSGALIGSTPLAKKRSQRRKKLKKARAEAENALNM